MTERLRPAAFFDFDSTLLRVDSAEVGIRYLLKRKEISFAYALKIWLANQLYKRNWLSSERMALMCLGFYKGRELQHFSRESDAYYHEILKPLLAPTMCERLAFHRARGDVLVILSASIRYMLDPAARDLGFDHLLCTDLEEGPDGRLTGRPLGGGMLLGPRKEEAARRLASEAGLDLARSFAYSDHHSDWPMLKMVGQGYAVNPTRLLRRLARQDAMPIIEGDKA